MCRLSCSRFGPRSALIWLRQFFLWLKSCGMAVALIPKAYDERSVQYEGRTSPSFPLIFFRSPDKRSIPSVGHLASPLPLQIGEPIHMGPIETSP